MADQSKRFDISPEQLRLEVQRNARRNALRQEYYKQIGNPFKAGSGEGGFPLDTGLQRFVSAKVKTYEYFRPTLRNTAIYYGLCIFPVAAYCWLLKSSKDKQEHLYRTGQVSYAERKFKFV